VAELAAIVFLTMNGTGVAKIRNRRGYEKSR